MTRTRALAVIALIAACTACAVRLGGPGPEELRVVLATPRVAPAAAAMGEWLRALDAQIAFVATPADSAWLATAGSGAALVASGPAADALYARMGDEGASDPVGLGILAWTAEGDTAVVLAADGARLLVQDALYRTERGKLLDLMVANVPAGADPREATRALMTYIATDVDHDAIVMLALRAYDRPLADSIGALLEPAFAGVARCEDQHDMIAAIQPGALRLYYSPAIRVRCDAVRGFDSPFPALLARVVLDG